MGLKEAFSGAQEDSSQQFGTSLGVHVLTKCGRVTLGSRNINRALQS